jgi:thiamine transporter ThiT
MSGPHLLAGIALLLALLGLILGIVGLARGKAHTPAQRQLFVATVLWPLALFALALPMLLDNVDDTTRIILVVVSVLLTAAALVMVWRAHAAQGQSR